MSYHVEAVCPRETADGTPCEAPIRFELDYEQADPHWGADADGNRGMYVPGYWYLASVTPQQCPKGHDLTEDEQKGLEAEAESMAKYYEVER